MEKKVDDAWKDRAEKEKQTADERTRRDAEARMMPAASFAMLLETYALQAIIALGGGRTPEEAEDAEGADGIETPEKDLRVAKFAIDMLGVIEQKTKGNLTPDEETGLRSLLQDLRLRYLEAVRAETGGGEAGPEGPGQGA
ncbi:MAG: DUF1844 domain-containing protein [Planctomycetes bacterium]|nr:DUF1844 domain-containing protein [Planctomycetota bacterium]